MLSSFTKSLNSNERFYRRFNRTVSLEAFSLSAWLSLKRRWSKRRFFTLQHDCCVLRTYPNARPPTCLPTVSAGLSVFVLTCLPVCVPSSFANACASAGGEDGGGRQSVSGRTGVLPGDCRCMAGRGSCYDRLFDVRVPRMGSMKTKRRNNWSSNVSSALQTVPIGGVA